MTDTQSPSESYATCVGRFCFQLPSSFDLTGGTFAFQGVELEEVYGSSLETAAAASALAARRAEIQDLVRLRPSPEYRTGEILEDKTLIPGKLSGLLYVPETAAGTVIWTALLTTPSSGIWLSARGPEGKAAALSEKLIRLADAFVPYKEGQHRPPDSSNAFALRTGFFPLPPDGKEGAALVYQDNIRQVRVELEIETTRAPEQASLAERFAEEAVRWSGLFKDDLHTYRNHRRRVASLPGHELMISSNQGARPEFGFTWRFPGKSNSAAKPAIDLSMFGPPEQMKASVAIWDTLLESFKPLS